MVDGFDMFGYTVQDAFGNTSTHHHHQHYRRRAGRSCQQRQRNGRRSADGGRRGWRSAKRRCGADGSGIAGVRAAGNDTTTAVTTGVGTNIAGLHGTLHLNVDGSYTYQSTANNISTNTTDVFVYTLKDGDGDLSTTTLTINLGNVTLVADNQTKTVDEAALDTSTSGNDLGHGTVTGSSPGSAAETVTGQLAVAGGTSAISYTPQSLTTAHGVFQLNANGSYVYTLTSPFTKTPAANDGTVVDGFDSFGYTAQDAFGNTVNGTITINANDDVPSATPPATLVNRRFRTPTC